MEACTFQETLDDRVDVEFVRLCHFPALLRLCAEDLGFSVLHLTFQTTGGKRHAAISPPWQKKNSGLKQTLYPKRANASQQRGDRRKRAEQ